MAQLGERSLSELRPRSWLLWAAAPSIDGAHETAEIAREGQFDAALELEPNSAARRMLEATMERQPDADRTSRFVRGDMRAAKQSKKTKRNQIVRKGRGSKIGGIN